MKKRSEKSHWADTTTYNNGSNSNNIIKGAPFEIFDFYSIPTKFEDKSCVAAAIDDVDVGPMTFSLNGKFMNTGKFTALNNRFDRLCVPAGLRLNLTDCYFNEMCPDIIHTH